MQNLTFNFFHGCYALWKLVWTKFMAFRLPPRRKFTFWIIRIICHRILEMLLEMGQKMVENHYSELKIGYIWTNHLLVERTTKATNNTQTNLNMFSETLLVMSFHSEHSELAYADNNGSLYTLCKWLFHILHTYIRSQWCKIISRWCDSPFLFFQV